MLGMTSIQRRNAHRALALVAGLWAAVSLAAAALPSARVDHPAVAEKERDYRLMKDPDDQKALAERAMAMELDALLNYIGLDNGIYHTFSCPDCGGGLTFTFDHPEALTCKKCGATIDEKKIEPNAEVRGKGPKGDPVVLRYHRDGYKMRFPSGLMRNLRNSRIAEATRALGRMYHDTGEEKYAARAVAILDRFAQMYPHWPVVEIRHFPRPSTFFIEPERPYDHWVHVKWRHSHNYDIPYDLTFAYDFVYKAQEWQKRPRARERVENDLLRAGYRHAWAVHEDMGLQVNNLTGTLIAETILLGRVLGDPDMVHRAVYTLQDMLRVFYHFDGMEYEGALTYHGTVTGRAAIAERMLEGYEDPPGYKDEKYGIALDGRGMREKIPVYKRAWDIWDIMKLPNGRAVCIHDTNWSQGGEPLAPGESFPNIALNAYGHFALARGKDTRGMQAHLHFCPFAQQSHYHVDRPNLILFGAGQEVLSDIGYVHVRHKNRYFANAAISHNTVIVEYPKWPERPELAEPDPAIVGTVERPKARARLNRDAQDARSTLILYAPGLAGDKRVQALACSVPGPPYREIQRRTRELLLVALDEERSCLVDILRVRGGVRHTQVLKPSSDEDVATEDLSLTLGAERPGTLAGKNLAYDEQPRRRDTVIPYSWLVHKIRTAAATEDWSMTWTGKDSGARLRVFGAGAPEAELWLGRSPTMRRANNNDKFADDFQNPHALVRRDEKGDGNTFVTVYETVAKDDSPLIREAAFQLGKGDGGAVGIRLTLNGGETLAVSATCTDTIGAQAIEPAYDVRRQAADGKTLWCWRYDPSVARAKGTGRFALKDVLRAQEGDAVNGFVVEGEVPESALRPGQWVRVLYGQGRALGYEVASVDRQGGDTRIEIDGEPGFDYDGEAMRMLYYPFYETPGVCVVEVAAPVFN